jgi:hypothetical protein
VNGTANEIEVSTSDSTTTVGLPNNTTITTSLTVGGLYFGTGSGDGDNNLAIGSSMGSGTGKRNTAIGSRALESYSGTGYDNNTAVGFYNMRALTTGSGNTAMGAENMFSLTTGIANTSIGNQTMLNVSTGSNNTGVGQRAGQSITTGTNNTLIGFNADVSSSTANNETVIGKGATGSGDNTVQLGNTSVTNVNTSGTITAGAITIPNTDGTNGQVLTTDGSGALTWTTSSAGAQGPTGPTGSTGVQGVAGPTGNIGATGLQGETGVAGPAGADGVDGSDGNGIASNTNNNDGTFTLTYTDGSTFTTSDFTGPQGLAGADGSDATNFWTESGANLHRSSGNVGIGTTTPVSALHVKTTTQFQGIFLDDESGLIAKIARGDATGDPYFKLYSSISSNGVDIQSNGSSYFNGGNVGIGTVSPAQLLHVKAASGDAKVLINANGEGDEAHLMLRTGGINKTAIVASGISNWGRTDLRFILNSYTNANNYGLSDTKMIIKNDGKVGIGTNSPTEKLDVAGNIKFNGALMPNNNAGSSGQVLTSSGTGVPSWTTISGGATTLAALTDVITTGQSSILIGGGSSSANYNTAFGYSSLDATSSEKNAAFGHNSLTNSTSGGSNSGFGQDSGKNIITGSFNTVLGRKSGFDISSGEYNVMLGFNAGDNITTNSQNTFIGSNTVGGNTTNASVLGYGITSQGSNTVTLGNTDITDIYMAQDSGATIHAADLNLGGTAVTATATEINFIDGVTSNVQTQIDALSSSSSVTTYTVNTFYAELGGFVIEVRDGGKHGLVVAMQDQDVSTWFPIDNLLNDATKHDADGAKFMDWRLPTIRELELIYIAKANISPMWIVITKGEKGPFGLVAEDVGDDQYRGFFTSNSDIITSVIEDIQEQLKIKITM